ncbi:MAG: glutamate racemase [Candidatus Cloacimonetes bacterium]|nr:glutamate racemase [Candidatus Cloacimonadota bacterium]
MKQPIGVFDSGVGGLTVFREIRKKFPHESIVYFGDTARVPYGPKSCNTVIDYSIQNARFLLQERVKLIVVACNTASSVALPELRKLFPVAVIGVIEPGAYEAVKSTRNSRIGVIGTDGTIRSGAYRKAIHKLQPAAMVIEKSTPLLVPLAEEGWTDNSVTRQIVAEYLEPMLKEGIDTLVLGCTHYPILAEAIAEVAGDKVTLIDSAQAIANQLEDILPFPESGGNAYDRFFVSDNEEKFRDITSRIIGSEVELLKKVNLGESWFVDWRSHE